MTAIEPNATPAGAVVADASGVTGRRDGSPIQPGSGMLDTAAQPQGRNPEQTTGAAVGGVSANIPDDVMDGYLDGFGDNRPDFPQASNRSALYRFGWLNGRDDRVRQPRATVRELRDTLNAIRKGA